MGLDLSGVRRVVEGMLDDELELWRDAGGRTDDVLDEVTGELTPGVPTPALLWEGSGAVLKSGQLIAMAPLDGAIAPLHAATPYQALLPLDSPEAKADDVLAVGASQRDPQLTGRRFRVAEVEVGTFVVVRVLRLEVTG